jgi:hypothetical protein
MKYIILLILALSFPAMAEDKAASQAATPACTSKTAGQVSCQANRMCECKHYNASLMAGTPEGYRWDCGITRPNCMDYNKIEETKPYDGPSSVNLGDDHNVEVNN